MCKKITGWYVVLNGDQIAWYAWKKAAQEHAKKVGGSLSPTYE